MSAAENEPPLTAELLADLQAGLLDDDTAARVRNQIRTDPQAEATLRALQQVRQDLAALDESPAPDPPPDVTAQLSAALQSFDAGAAHAARPRIRPARVIAGVAGLGAVAAAIGFGTRALLNEPTPTAPSAPATAQHITVSTPPPTIPLSPAEILELLHQPPAYGPLSSPALRASCLSGLGYPAATQVLAARPVDINARPGVLLVVQGDTPGDLAVYAVALNCSAADTGLLASTTVPRS
ncbi:hypothetical protein [Mycobacterium angelicum]|uniref:Anti-sigma-M factor RsmA n=1 Tax=Mycobacterium angelicum TaxID=470074 RepID=A0A1W9ZZK2_MYCAN|nr:hypothetical protein [Mycobacterium angelicum]MCV7198967.1 hypothetical protein [Mycobacterium angelicum]ORA22936.1 hypothetical protein BST12_07935 [Mycobacterium angelicum]